MTSVDIELPYKPRDYQMEFENAMFSGKKRAMLVWHRRAGKDIAALNFMANEMIKQVGIYFYFFPQFSQARSVIWDGMDEAGIPIINAFPKELIENKNQTRMQIKLKNGSIFQLVGTDNYNAVAGNNITGCVFSEYSLQDPTCWELIVSPILNKNGGWAVFNGTPRGKNHQWQLDCTARAFPDVWYYKKLTNDDTHLFTEESIEQQRREGRSEELIQQEYYCSYERGVEGSYYARLIERARQEKRIGNVHYEPRSTVNTYWDIGFGDSTSIVFGQDVGSEFRIIDYYEASGESVAHYAKKVQEKPYVYGMHYMPHDAGSGSIQTGQTLQKVAQDLGLKVTVLPRDDLEVGIEAARSMLSVAYIDETKCKRLIQCLESYHKKFNDKMNVYSDKPVHDWSSHGADAIRYAAMARSIYGRGAGSNLTPNRINEMRQRNLGY